MRLNCTCSAGWVDLSAGNGFLDRALSQSFDSLKDPFREPYQKISALFQCHKVL